VNNSQVVLLGLPGAGKTTVGQALAALLGWTFLDFDQQIEAETGLTVAEIFVRYGEAHFRGLEADLTKRLASRHQVVFAPGGGWITNAELPALLQRDAVLIWLRVQPETALVRLRATGVQRPLLQVTEPLDRLRALLDQRKEQYQRAHFAFDTDQHTPHQVAASIYEWLKRQNRSAWSS
jgi:shikimate kinase